MSEEIIETELEDDATEEEIEVDPVEEAKKNAENIIKDAQRKQSEAAEMLRQAREEKAQLDAAKQTHAASSEDEDPDLAELDPKALKILEKVVKRSTKDLRDELEASKQESMQGRFDAVIDSFSAEHSDADEATLQAINDYFIENSIKPDSPAALKKALNNTYKVLKNDPETAVAKRIAELEKKGKGKVVSIDKKGGKVVTDDTPLWNLNLTQAQIVERLAAKRKD